MNLSQTNFNYLNNFISKNDSDYSKEKKEKRVKNNFSSTKYLINNNNFPKRPKNFKSSFNLFNNNTDFLI